MLYALFAFDLPKRLLHEPFLFYKWVEDYQKTTMRIDADWIHHEYLVWPLNLGNNHWVVALMKTAPGSKIYFCYSFNRTDLEREKAFVPTNLHRIISILGDILNPQALGQGN